MAGKKSTVCINHFKNTDPAARREEFNRLMAVLICRTENLRLIEKPEVKRKRSGPP